VDNTFDMHVLKTYLGQYFNGSGKPLGGVSIPSTNNMND